MAASDEDKTEQRYQSAFDRPGRLYHGTNAVLKRGAVLQPAGAGGFETTHADATHYKPTDVYLSDQPHLAGRYAYGRARRLGGDPHVYEVSPAGLTMRDPEYLESGFGKDQWIASKAHVVGEVDKSEWHDPRLEKLSAEQFKSTGSQAR